MNAYQMPTSYGVLLILTTWCAYECTCVRFFAHFLFGSHSDVSFATSFLVT